MRNKSGASSPEEAPDVESKLARFLQLIGIIKGTIFRKVKTESILKTYNILVLPTFYMGQKIGL